MGFLPYQVIAQLSDEAGTGEVGAVGVPVEQVEGLRGLAIEVG
jgi:hypothetical protein